ncbi:hypothetical protein DFJ74DRAFT_707212 [Hyaloraphidium curvatum]|nr:hypothetical protein DFJ74DRAFT_707212 [Hyaloraphidium curvatum]
MATVPAYSWEQLSSLSELASEKNPPPNIYDPNGPTSAQSNLRLFGTSEADVRVTLYRDFHAWCPYCQKTWLFLEEKRIPFRVKKVTMFCYGQKEAWYKRIVPSGMLPALELDGKVITESDDILAALEKEFGPLERSMFDPTVMRLRRLERELFYDWCHWLCRTGAGSSDIAAAAAFESTVEQMEQALGATPGPFFLEKFSIADVVFVPYVERMNASLFYFKGYKLRDPVKHPRIAAWFDALEQRETYRGMESDFHTHAHDLPPQMGSCIENGTPAQLVAKKLVDSGPWGPEIPEVGFPCPDGAEAEALRRVLKHAKTVIRVNKEGQPEQVDVCLRAALTTMVRGSFEKDLLGRIGEPADAQLPSRGDSILRYIRDRISVPRDMSLHAGRKMREALEQTAAKVGNGQGQPLRLGDRRDQDPTPFRSAI